MPDAPGAKELTSQEARRLEKLFLGRCKENLQNAGEVFNPLNKDTLSYSFAEQHYEPHTSRKSIKEIMEENEIYDKPLLDKVPLGRRFHYVIHEHGIFDKSPAVMVSAFVRCEFADFIKDGKSATPAPASEVESARLDAMQKTDIFHYIGIYALCGFEEAVSTLPFSGPNWELALVTHVEGTEWKIVSGEPGRRETVLALFDPEKESEKLWRAKSIISSSPELSVSGGFLVLSDLVEESGLTAKIVRKAAGEFCAQNKSMAVERVEGKLILKHSRI